MMREIRDAQAASKTPLVISGCIGPRGDGYDPGARMRADDAQDYHAWQIGVLKDAGADLVSAFTMTNIGEAVGVACAAKAVGIPCVISFTLETDGRLPTGESLGYAIETVDRATSRAPAYYMINCAHPDHFREVLDQDAGWVQRLRGIRANASRKSHAELDNSTELDAGHPQELGEQYAELLLRFPQINVLGGCCGTDHRHVAMHLGIVPRHIAVRRGPYGSGSMTTRSEAGNRWLFMRQPAIVDVEIRIEDRLALGAEKSRLRLDPLARLLLFGVSEEARLQIGRDVGMLVGDIVLLAGIIRQIEQLGLTRQQRDLDQLPLAFADGAAKGLDVDQDILVRRRCALR